MIDLTPKSIQLPIAEVELQVPAGTQLMGERIGGLSAYSNSFRRGYGQKVFGSDANGIWLGEADFENAPFRVSMDGSLYAQSKDGSLKLDTPNDRIIINIAGVDQILLGKF